MHYIGWVSMNEVKYLSLSETIEENIRNGVYSGKLPPVRTLSNDLKVSTRTINKALKPLIARGLIIPDGPRGILIGELKMQRKKTGVVGVFYSGKALTLANDPLINALKKSMEADNYKMLLMSMLDEELHMDMDFWSSSWLDGYIFLYSSFNKRFVSGLKKKNIPFVAANWVPPEYGVNSVDFDNSKSLRATVDYLYNVKGFRKIAFDFDFIEMKQYHDYIKDRCLNILREYGIHNDYYFYCGAKSKDNTPEKHINYFGNLNNIPEALILVHSSAKYYQEILMERNLSIYLIEHDTGSPNYKPYSYPYLSINYCKLAKSVWSNFLRILKVPNADVRNDFVESDFILGKGVL